MLFEERLLSKYLVLLEIKKTASEQKSFPPARKYKSLRLQEVDGIGGGDKRTERPGAAETDTCSPRSMSLFLHRNDLRQAHGIWNKAIPTAFGASHAA